MNANTVVSVIVTGITVISLSFLIAAIAGSSVITNVIDVIVNCITSIILLLLSLLLL